MPFPIVSLSTRIPNRSPQWEGVDPGQDIVHLALEPVSHVLSFYDSFEGLSPFLSLVGGHGQCSVKGLRGSLQIRRRHRQYMFPKLLVSA